MIDMLSGPYNYGKTSRISKLKKVTLCSSMNASSRPEGTKRMPGLINELISSSKIVQESNLVKLSVLLSVSATVYSTSRSLISHSPKKNLSHFSEI